MAHQVAICFLFVALGSLGLGARINYSSVKHVSTDPDAGTKKWCETEITDFATAIGFRISIFLGPKCGGQLAPRVKGEPPALTEAGYESICKPSCAKLSELHEQAPDWDMIQEECTDDNSLKLIKEANTAMPLHDYLNDVWFTCLEQIEDDGSDADEVDYSLKPEVDEYGKPILDGKEPWETDDYGKPDLDGKEPWEIGTDESPSVKYPEIEEHDVAPPSRSMVKQVQLAYKLNNAFAVRTKANCDTLVTVFGMFDYRHTGRLTREDVDLQLDKLSDVQKKEALQEFDRLQGEAKKAEYLTFMDVVTKKLDVRNSLKCYYKYVGAEE